MSAEPSKKNFVFAQIILTLCISMAVASVISIFLFLLSGATDFFETHWKIAVLALPLWGIALFQIQKTTPFKSMATAEAIIEEIRDPRKRIPTLLTPFILLTTVVSHLFGASVGRESAAVQIGASVAEFVSELFKKIFKLPENRSLILRLGLASGFSAAFGAPWTAVIFALEHPQHFSKTSFRGTVWIFLCSFGAYLFSSLWGPAHTHWPQIEFAWETISLSQWLVFSLVLAVFSFAYEGLIRLAQSLQTRQQQGELIFIAGVLVAGLTLWTDSPIYNGLGLNLTQLSLEQDTTWSLFFHKTVFLILSVGGGFKGGEVTPLIAVAALLANSLTSSFIFVSVSLSSIFSFRLRAPLAGVVILGEFFSWKIALLGCGPIIATWLINEALIRAQLTEKLKINSTFKRYF